MIFFPAPCVCVGSAVTSDWRLTMGALDSNGIWIYDENEDAAPFSTMLNRLGESVSDVLTPSTATVTFGGGAASGGLTLGKVGGIVAASCSFQIGSASHNTAVGTIPVGFRPLSDFTGYVNLTPNSATNPG